MSAQGCLSEREGFLCTRPRGHIAKLHIARGLGGIVLKTWRDR